MEYLAVITASFAGVIFIYLIILLIDSLHKENENYNNIFFIAKNGYGKRKMKTEIIVYDKSYVLYVDDERFEINKKLYDDINELWLKLKIEKLKDEVAPKKSPKDCSNCDEPKPAAAAKLRHDLD